MKTVLINSDLFALDSNLSKGLISSLKLLQSKGCTLYVDSLLKVDSVISRLIILENIFLLENDNSIQCDFTISSADGNTLLINNNGGKANFNEAADYILSNLRYSEISRTTSETSVSIKVSLDSKEESNIKTGIGFFDHMLSQISRHGNIYLDINVSGDLEVDEHHTVEDTGLTLGMAIAEAIGDKAGIQRYGFFLPMDDSAAYCALDLGGRPYLKFNAKFQRPVVGNFPTELTEEFFRALSSGMKSNIHIKATGKNDHHKIECIFKAFAKALNEACRIDDRASGKVPSTKDLL